jgi:hypothetical protein
MVTELALQKAYEDVSKATQDTYSAGETYELAKEGLEKDILMATFEGRIQGKNEGERKAVALQMFPDKHEDMDCKENLYKVAGHMLSLARIRLDFIRDCIRIEELAKK